MEKQNSQMETAIDSLREKVEALDIKPMAKKSLKKCIKDVIKAHDKELKQSVKESKKNRPKREVHFKPVMVKGPLAKLLSIDPKEAHSRQTVTKAFYEILKTRGIKSENHCYDFSEQKDIVSVFGPAKHPKKKEDGEVCYSFYNLQKYLSPYLSNTEA